ncbi:MAG: glycosyltransferase family 39 protein [Clostridia bacterium]|nr:glycosyltransferase family 39 protein [Clostridia bacterium]
MKKNNPDSKKNKSGETTGSGLKAFFADKKKRNIAVAAAVLAVVILLIAVFAGGRKNVLSANFDSGLSGFTTDAYSRTATDFSEPNEGVNGTGCLKIVNRTENDARFTYKIKLQADKIYKLEADVKTENIVTGGSYGANVCILESKNGGFKNLVASNDWTHVENYVSAGKTDNYTLCLRLGYYGCTVTGTAWFDNVKVTEVAAAPAGRGVVKINSKTVTQDAQYNELLYDDMRKVSWLIFAFAAAALFIAYLFRRAYDRAGQEFVTEDGKYVPALNNGNDGKKLEAPYGSLRSVLVSAAVLFAGALAIRLVLSTTYFQCGIDVSLFRSWGRTAVDNGISKLYTVATNCDYPPLYIYFMYGAMQIAKLFKYAEPVTTMLVKLPSMLADIGIGAIVYSVAKKRRYSQGNALFFAAIWLLNPAVILDSACWGQVDSLLTLFVVLVCVFINRKQYLGAGIMFGLGVMLKPQMIIFAPVFGCAFIVDFILTLAQKKTKKAFLSLGGLTLGTVVSLVLPCIPFSNMGTAEVQLLGKTMKLPWIFSLFLGTIDHYAYTTVNCYNFWFLLGLNWKPDNVVKAGLSLHKWGMLAIVAISLGAVAMYAVRLIKGLSDIKHKRPLRESAGLVYAAGAYMFACVACFGPRMHERYFFPALALLLIAAVVRRRRIILPVYALQSCAGFIMVHEIMMGLLVGGSIKSAGGEYSAYADYYWPSLTDYRGFLAVLMVVSALLTAVVAAASVKPEKVFAWEDGGAQAEPAKAEPVKAVKDAGGETSAVEDTVFEQEASPAGENSKKKRK